MVCYRVIEAPCATSIGHVFAYLYTLDDDSERPMDYNTSLLPTVFPLLSVGISAKSKKQLNVYTCCEHPSQLCGHGGLSDGCEGPCRPGKRYSTQSRYTC